MILIAAVDNQYGMLFHQRRQSQDRILREHILALTQDKRLWMNAYSQKQFAEHTAPQIQVSEDLASIVQAGDYCFIENASAKAFEAAAERIILYHWNRTYPSDLKFDIDLEQNWRSVQVTDFQGNSHEKITEEIFEKR